MTTVVSDVRAIAGLPASTVVGDEIVQLYIDMANLIIVEDLAGLSYTQERLDLIELNLAAHFATLGNSKGGLIAIRVGDSEEKYRQMKDTLHGLGSTHFGQTAMSLDTAGILSKLSTSPIKAQFQVI